MIHSGTEHKVGDVSQNTVCVSITINTYKAKSTTAALQILVTPTLLKHDCSTNILTDEEKSALIGVVRNGANFK